MLSALTLLARLAAVGAIALVISDYGTTLTEIDAVSGTVTPNVASPGTFPNDVLWYLNNFFVVNSMSDDVTLQKFDPADWTCQALGIGTGMNCWAVRPLCGDTLAVSCALGNSIAIVDAAEMSLLGYVEGIGPNPEWFCVAEGKLYAACGGWLSDNKVVVMDIATLSPCDTISVGLNVQSCVYDGVDQVYAICTGTYGATDGEIHVIDIASGEVTGVITTGFAPSIGVCRGDSLYVGDCYGQGVILIDTDSGALVDPSAFPGGSGLAVDSDGILWVADCDANNVRRYDRGHQLVASYYVTSPYGLDVSADPFGVEPDSPAHAPDAEFSAGPSPAVGVVRVRTAVGETDPPVLLDLAGRTVGRAFCAEPGLWLLDVGRVPQGLYMVVSRQESRPVVVLR